MGGMSFNDPRALKVPTPPQGVEIASFATYLEAQKAVDVLADNAFAVQAVTIVGSDLQMVERVTGRLNYPRVAIAGALSGVWFGIFVGLIISMFSGAGVNVIGSIVTCAALGALYGMLFGVISYAFTGGKRDFVSSSQVVASRYAVLCLPDLAPQARAHLSTAGIRSSGAPVGAANSVAQQSPFTQQSPGTPRTHTQVVRPAPPAGPPQYGANPTAPGQAEGPGVQDAAVIPDQGAPAPVRPVQPSAANEPPRYGARIDDDQPKP